MAASSPGPSLPHIIDGTCHHTYTHAAQLSMPSEAWFFLVEKGPKSLYEAPDIEEEISTHPFHRPVLISNRQIDKSLAK